MKNKKNKLFPIVEKKIVNKQSSKITSQNKNPRTRSKPLEGRKFDFIRAISNKEKYKHLRKPLNRES